MSLEAIKFPSEFGVRSGQDKREDVENNGINELSRMVLATNDQALISEFYNVRAEFYNADDLYEREKAFQKLKAIQAKILAAPPENPMARYKVSENNFPDAMKDFTLEKQQNPKQTNDFELQKEAPKVSLWAQLKLKLRNAFTVEDQNADMKYEKWANRPLEEEKSGT